MLSCVVDMCILYLPTYLFVGWMGGYLTLLPALLTIDFFLYELVLVLHETTFFVSDY